MGTEPDRVTGGSLLGDQRRSLDLHDWQRHDLVLQRCHGPNPGLSSTIKLKLGFLAMKANKTIKI